MAAGFESISDSGSVQVTQDYRNLQLVFAGTDGIGPNTTFRNRLRTCSRHALVAYQFLTNPGVCPHIGNYAPQRDMSFMYDTFNPNQSFNYWIFDLVTPVSGSFGLEVFNSGGELCFSSSSFAMRVIDYFDATPILPISQPTYTTVVIYTNNSGKTVAYAPVQTNTYYDFDGQDIEEGLFFLQNFNNQLLATGGYFLSDAPSMGQSIRSGPAVFRSLVLDITNYPTSYARY